MGMIGNTLAQGLISGANIQDGTVDTPDLKDSAVTTAKVADGAVTNAKINDVAASKVTGTVGTSQIADDSVTNAKLASGIDASKLTTGTLPNARIADNTLDAAKLADGTVTSGKLAAGSAVANIGFIPAVGQSSFTPGQNMDAFKTSGLYHYDNGIGGTLPPDNALNYRTLEIGTDGRYSQLAFPWNSNRIFARRVQDATIHAWNELVHSGNSILNYSHFETNAKVSRYRGGLGGGEGYLDGLDDYWGDYYEGYWVISHTAYSSFLFVQNAGGSVGTIQWACSYSSAMYRRNRTDNISWSSWRQVD